jgi:hypothetical protein
MTANMDTLPGCIGCYGHAIAPNGPCDGCRYARLCLHVESNFVPKKSLEPILARLTELEQMLRR